MQSSQNRLALDRNDALNSAVSNERDMAAFFYWAPAKIRTRFTTLNAVGPAGLKGSGDYGVIGMGVYNGQTANRAEANNNLHYVARVTYPWQLKNGQYIEASLQGFTGRSTITSDIRSTGTRGTPDFTYSDRRVAATLVMIVAEWAAARRLRGGDRGRDGDRVRGRAAGVRHRGERDRRAGGGDPHRGHTFPERLGLDQDAITAPVDPAHHALHEPQDPARAHGPGGRQAFGPQVLHPEQQWRLAQVAHHDGGERHRHRRGREDEDGVEAPLRAPGAEQAAAQCEGRIVQGQQIGRAHV